MIVNRKIPTQQKNYTPLITFCRVRNLLVPTWCTVGLGPMSQKLWLSTKIPTRQKEITPPLITFCQVRILLVPTLCTVVLQMLESVTGLQNMPMDSLQNFKSFTFFKLKDTTNSSKVLIVNQKFPQKKIEIFFVEWEFFWFPLCAPVVLTPISKGGRHKVPTLIRYGYREKNCLGDWFDFSWLFLNILEAVFQQKFFRLLPSVLAEKSNLSEFWHILKTQLPSPDQILEVRKKVIK